MTKGIENTLGLRSLDEALRAFGAETNSSGNTEIVEEYIEDIFEDDETSLMITSGHGEEIDQLLDGSKIEAELDRVKVEFMRHAETLTELALELDPGRAPRAFEVANAFLKNAMDAVSMKREFQLKTMKALQDQRKIELEERKLAGKAINAPVGAMITTDDGLIHAEATVVTTNTADMLRQLQSEIAEMKSSQPPINTLSPDLDDKN